MIELDKILNHLEFSEEFKNLLLGKIEIPYISDAYVCMNQKKPMFFYPPMLVPIFVNYSSPSYKGLIMHPLNRKRKNTYVSYYIESENILEIAFDEDQFSTLMVLEMNMIIEGLDNNIDKFCDEINYTKAREVDIFAEKHGDNIDFFNELVYFIDNLPLRYCKNINKYNGNYPSSINLINEKVLTYSSSYELNNNIEIIKELPIWLSSDRDLEKIFFEYFEKKEFDTAWFILNNKKWNLKKLAECLTKLIEKVNDPLMNIISENWLRNYHNWL